MNRLRVILTLAILLISVRSTATASTLTQLYATKYTSNLRLIERIEKQAGDVGDEFLYYLHTLIHVESNYNTQAFSSKGAVGLMQITGLAVQDAALHCRLAIPPASDLLYVGPNVVYGTCYLGLLLDKYDGDWYSVLTAYHGGFAAAKRLSKGQLIGRETSNYVLKILYLLRDQPATTHYHGEFPGGRTRD